MPDSSVSHRLLLQTLAGAPSRQHVLNELLQRLDGLESVSLWWEADDVRTLIARAGPDRPERPPLPLMAEHRYLISWSGDAKISEELIAVMGLRFVLLDAQDTMRTLRAQFGDVVRDAHTDALTGLRNRRAFDADLEALDAGGNPFAVVFIDLNGFKSVNDEHGHALGDALLRGYATWLERVVGHWGHSYRLGGDEMVVLVSAFPGTPQEFEVWARERLQVPFVDGVSASIGIAWRHEGWRAADVLRLADTRMYDAKRHRRVHAGTEDERRHPPVQEV